MTHYSLVFSLKSCDSYLVNDSNYHFGFISRYLHSNKLTGSIPPELGNMSKLHYLYDQPFLDFSLSHS